MKSIKRINQLVHPPKAYLQVSYINKQNNHLEHNCLDVVVVQDELLDVGCLPEKGVGDHRQPVTGEVQSGQPGIKEMSRRKYGDLSL